jgi:hypothetical protein
VGILSIARRLAPSRRWRGGVPTVLVRGLAPLAIAALLAVGCSPGPEGAASGSPTGGTPAPSGAVAPNACSACSRSNGVPTAEEVRVSLGSSDHLVTVVAMINGNGPYRLVLDTGAAGATRLTPEVARDLHLPQVGTVRDGDPSGRNQIELPLVKIEMITIGDAGFSDVVATVGGQLPGTEADGVLGLDLFAGWLVTIDYPAHELRLEQGAVPETGEHVVGYTAGPGVPQIEIFAGGVALTADIDTGGPAVLTVPSARGLGLTGEPQPRGSGRTASETFTVYGATLEGALMVAGWAVPNAEVQIVDHFPTASLGAGFLSGYSLTFDLANQRVAFEKAGSS